MTATAADVGTHRRTPTDDLLLAQHRNAGDTHMVGVFREPPGFIEPKRGIGVYRVVDWGAFNRMTDFFMAEKLA
jgi:hypothetical protein